MPKGKKTIIPKLTQKQKEYDAQVKQLEKKLKAKAKRINKRGFITPEDLFPEKPQKRLPSYLKKLQERIENIYDYALYVKAETGEVISGLKGRAEERRRAAQKAAQTKHEKEQIKRIEQFNDEYEKFREKYKEQIESDDYFDFNPKEESPFAKPPQKKKKPESREPTPEEWEALPHEAEIILDRVYDEVRKWSPDPRWSGELSEIKREDKDQLRSILDGAIQQLGREQVIRNLADNAEEFEALCMEVMYVSGSNMRETGREGIRLNLARISEMVWGRALSVEESQILQRQAEMYTEYE